MKHLKLFEDFFNENEEKFEIARLVDGKIKEMVTGTVEEIKHSYSAAIEDASGKHQDFKGKDPETIDELLTLLNHAQKMKEKTQNPKTVWELN